MINPLWRKLHRLPCKLRQELWRVPAFRTLALQAYQTARDNYISSLPIVAPEDQPLLRTLRQQGVVVTSLEKWQIPSTSRLIATTHQLLPQLEAIAVAGKAPTTSIPASMLMNFPDIMLWGLQARVLDLVEAYLGLPVCYQGAELRRDVTKVKLTGIRQWHLDPEDYRMVKIIIYLNDVNQATGPFEYLCPELTALAVSQMKYSSGLIPDTTLQQVVPRSAWQSCTGVAGTVAIADTCNILHRMKPPVAADRCSLTFSYTSRQFRRIGYSNKVPASELLGMLSQLSPRQREYLLAGDFP